MRILQITLSLSLILLFTTAASAKIVFSAYQDRNDHIYVMDDDGSNIRQLTNYPHMEVQPRWSPDGTQIAFLRDTDPSSSIRLNTFIMNADGTNVRQLTNHRGNDKGLTFSPDGKKLLVSSHPNTGVEKIGLYVIDIESGNTQKISNLEISAVDWSPDGKHIVFVDIGFWATEDNLWMMNADGSDPRPWTPPIKRARTMDRGRPKWSPDGQQILYTETYLNVQEMLLDDGGVFRRIRAAGKYRYIIRNVNGGATERLNIPKGWVARSVAWMNGQESVLFSAFVDFEHKDEWNRTRWVQLYKYDLASEQITQLTHDPGSKMSADWVRGAYAVSPAGKQSVRWGELKKAYSD
ncbi:MAG: hypothetical protein OXU23_18215 [Candidatus Poribacteria bacterium]|nr:hypothetical protein [Candidatus Poribacteria bacterium]